MDDIKTLITRLHLEPLPGEGGYFASTYRSARQVPTPRGSRPAASAIYYLLTPDGFSALHRLPNDEIFHFYAGDPVELHLLGPAGQHELRRLGPLGAGESLPQQLAPGGWWQGSRLAAGGRWALLGCTMSPGWAEADFELGRRESLLAAHPNQREIILALTRP